MTTERFKSFPYTPDSDPTQDYQVANKQYVDSSVSNAYSSIRQLSTSLSDVYGSVGAIIGGTYSVENPTRVWGNASADSASTSLALNFESTYFSLALTGANTLSIQIAQSGVDHTSISNRGTIGHASIETIFTSVTGAITNISTTVGGLSTTGSTAHGSISNAFGSISNAFGSISNAFGSVSNAFSCLSVHVSDTYPHIGSSPKVGFDSRTSSSLSMNSSSFIIAPLTGSTFRVWTSGLEYDQSTTLSVPIANDNTLHYVYFDTSGSISVGTAAWDISGESAPCAMVYRTGTKYAIFDERHGSDRNRDWHEWAHDTIGCRYESGLGGTLADSTFSFAVGALHDEDIDISIDTQTVGKIWYRNAGGATNTFTSTSVPYLLSGDGNPQFDNAGTVTSVTTNQYFNSWFYGTNEQEHPIFIVAGQNTYNTLSGARNEGLPTIQVATREWKLLYRAIYRNVGGAGDYIETTDYRVVSSGPGSSYTPNSHLTLTDIGTVGHLTIDAVLATISASYFPSTSNMIDSVGLSIFSSATTASSTKSEGFATSVFTSATAASSTKAEGFATSIHTDLTTSVSGAVSTAAEYGVSVFSSATNKASTQAESIGLSVFSSATTRSSTQAESIGTSVFGSASNAVSMTASTLWESIANLTGRVTEISHSITGLWASLSTVNETGGGAVSVSLTTESFHADIADIESVSIASRLYSPSISAEFHRGSSASISVYRGTSLSASSGWLVSLILSGALDAASVSSDLFIGSSSSISVHRASSISMSTGGFTSLTGDFFYAASASIDEYNWGAGGGITTASVQNIVSQSISTEASTRLSADQSIWISASEAMSASMSNIWSAHMSLSDDISASISIIWTTIGNISNTLGSFSNAIVDISSSVADLTASVSTLWEGIASTSTTVRASASTMTEQSVSVVRASLAALSVSVGDIYIDLTTSVSGGLSTAMEGLTTTGSIWVSIDNQVSSVGALTARVTSISNVIMTSPIGGLQSVSIQNRLYSPSITTDVLRASRATISTTLFTAYDVISVALGAASASVDQLDVLDLTVSTAYASQFTGHSVSASLITFEQISGSIAYLSSTIYAGHMSCSSYSWTAGGLTTASVQDMVSLSTTVLWSAMNTLSVWIASVHTDMTTSVSGAVSTAAERFSTTGSVGLLWDTVTVAWASIAGLRASVTAIEDRVISLSTTLPNLWTTVANLSQSVSNYQSAMLTSITTDHLFISTYLSMAGGASINTSNFIRFNVDGSTPLIVSANQINFYSPIEAISCSLDLNSWGLTASSISLSALRGNSISISNLYATSASIDYLDGLHISASTGYVDATLDVDELNVSTSAKIYGHLGVGASGNVRVDRGIHFLETFSNNVSVSAGMYMQPKFNPSSACVANYAGIGGFVIMSNMNYDAGSRAFGLKFAAYVGNSAGHATNLSTFGCQVYGAQSYAGTFHAADVIGLACGPWYSYAGSAYIVAERGIGCLIDVPDLGCYNISTDIGLLVKNTTEISSQNRYQVQLDGFSTGAGIFFNVSNSTNFSRIYQSTSNNLVVAVNNNPIIAVSQSAFAFFTTSTKVQQTIRPTTGWSTSLKYFPTVGSSSVIDISAASVQPWMSNVGAALGTIMDRLCSIGIFRSS